VKKKITGTRMLTHAQIVYGRSTFGPVIMRPWQKNRVRDPDLRQAW